MTPWAHMGPRWGPYKAHMGPYGGPWAPWALADGPWPIGLEDPPVGIYSRARGRWGPMEIYFRARGRWGPMGSMGLGDPPMGVSSSRTATLPPQDAFDPGPPGPIKSGWGPRGNKIFTDFQVRGSIPTNFHEFSRFLSIFGL